jgi:hypothetical protein
MFLKPEDLENVRVGSLLSLVANKRLCLIFSRHESARRYNEIIWVSLGSAIEPLAIFTTTIIIILFITFREYLIYIAGAV